MKLCAGDNPITDEIAPVFTGHGWEDWKPDDVITVHDCQMTKLKNTQCFAPDKLPREQFNVECTTAMPPTYHFQFQTDVPVNNKWFMADESSSVKNLPEYLIDINHVFMFTYDDAVSRWV